jgi:hypothetical protein
MFRFKPNGYTSLTVALLMALTTFAAQPIMVAEGAGATPAVTSSLQGQPCPAMIHDQYKVTGPDGKAYSTWHPAVDPTTGCYFGHEHGDNPTKSLANPKLPAFGYVDATIGHSEAHSGFKVFVVNRGTTNDEGRTAKVSTRLVFHMGTGGVKRFTEQFHEMQFDLVAPDGHYVHVQGMADTGQVGSICSSPRQGRTVVLKPGTGCNVNSLYEIWLNRLSLDNGRIEVIASTAVFDPMTVMDPANKSLLIKTADVFGTRFFNGKYLGCNREAYHGPVYWRNAGRSTVFYTDAMGKLGGPLRQEVSAHNNIGIPMNQDQTQMKLRSKSCAPGLMLPN